MSTATLTEADVAKLLTDLLGRNVQATGNQALQPHQATYQGLVTNDDRLVAVFGSDLEFAHSSGAALAMVPAGTVDQKGDTADPDLLGFYQEVANVLSRLIDNVTPERVRIDPSLEHTPEALQSIVSDGALMAACDTTIAGYGTGSFGVWYRES
jgi:hypothetical protein